MTPIEPPPSAFWLPDPDSAGDEDLVAVGGDLAPGTILQAYRRGMFPMHLSDGPLGWWSPYQRGVIPVDGLKVSRSLRQSARRYTVTIDQDFEGVVDACADPGRSGGWIRSEIREAYIELHRLGWAHSVETRLKRSSRRRTLRRRHRRAVCRRINVLPKQRRLQGCPPQTGGQHESDPGSAHRCAVGDRSSTNPWSSRDQSPGVSRPPDRGASNPRQLGGVGRLASRRAYCWRRIRSPDSVT